MSDQVFDYDMTLRTYLAAAGRPNISSQYAKLYGPQPLSSDDHVANLIRFIALHKDKSEMTFQLSVDVAGAIEVPVLAARSGTTIEPRTETKSGVRGDETVTLLRVRYGVICTEPVKTRPPSGRPAAGFGELGRALGGFAATAGMAIEAAATDVSERLDDVGAETELLVAASGLEGVVASVASGAASAGVPPGVANTVVSGVVNGVAGGVAEATAFVGAQLNVAPDPVTPIARPARSGPDPRVPIALRAAGVVFTEREGGDFVIVRRVNELEITVVIGSQTSVGGRLEVRSVWSEAPRKAGPLSKELADRILQLGAASSFGAWVVRAEPDGGRQAAFVAKVPADLDSTSLAAAIDHVVEEAVKVRS